jgi:hypothetical protein
MLLLAFITLAIVVVIAAGCWSVSLLFTLARRYYRQPRSTPFWRWPTAFAYGFVLCAVRHLLMRVGADPHAHPWPFVFFGLCFGLALTVLESEWDAAHRVHRDGWKKGQKAI